jgi:hypothetical protein
VTAGLSNFSIEATEDNNTLAYTLDLSATVSSPQIGGSVSIVTDIVLKDSVSIIPLRVRPPLPVPTTAA